jgi:hypothetical protein
LSLLPSLAMWMALPALAASDSKFAALRSAADPLGNLAAFLQRYIGDCDSGSGPRCHSQAISFRETSNGRRFVMLLGDESARILSAGRFDAGRREYELQLTPFFAAGRFALTHGAPKQTDTAGNPLMPPGFSGSSRGASCGSKWSSLPRTSGCCRENGATGSAGSNPASTRCK